MCIYSLSLSKGTFRRARVDETLTLIPLRHHQVLTAPDGMVACVRHGTKMMVEALNLDFERLGNYPQFGQPNGDKVNRKAITKWDGRSVEVVMARWAYGGYASDAVKLPDGTFIHLSWLLSGTKMSIPRKVRKDKGVKKPRNLVKVLGLDQPAQDAPVRESADA